MNHSGPYNFLLDTGTQFTMVDPSLAAELHMTEPGFGSGQRNWISYDGFHSAAGLSLKSALTPSPTWKWWCTTFRDLKSIDLQVRGILGEDFLQHFDMLIDNAHKMLCLDDSSAMRAEIKGTHIEMLTPTQAGRSAQLADLRSSSFGREAAGSLEARLRRKRSVSLQRTSIHGGGTISGSITARKRNEWIAALVRRFASTEHEDRLP